MSFWMPLEKSLIASEYFWTSLDGIYTSLAILLKKSDAAAPSKLPV